MGNQVKRAKRAKQKAHDARVQRQRVKLKESNSYEIMPKVFQLFETLPSPVEEQLCLERIYSYIKSDPEGDFDDPEAAVLILYSLYKEWHEERNS